MKHNRTTLPVLSVFALVAILLSACGPAATPVPPVATQGPVTLTVTGLVNSELQLTDSALHAMTVVTLNLTHPKNGPTDYSGVRLNDLLNQAGIKAGAVTVTLTASDGFASDLDLATVQACTDCLIAFDPANPGVYNAAMPDQSNKAWVKGLVSITVK
jgi:DMSO/TMAO reductase YedYZ molybdopterin-dependent catalytic subunit